MTEAWVEFEDVEEVLVVTPKALKCVFNGGEHWIARSQISEESEVREKGDSGTLIISRWLAEKAGLL